MDYSNSNTLRLVAGSVAAAAAVRGMENSAFEGDVDKSSMELSDVKVTNGAGGQKQRCEPELCRTVHVKMLQDKAKTSNPWDRLKTVFLVGIVATLALWLVVFVASSRMGLV